ncbi:hypothetical protein [Streptomyces sp. NPDC088246]|uniref:hypothetical protein n=1 Tax=Streptomyces sp. NPDC088246 TaxID=3365842 RepID=UPI0038031E31
MPYSPKARSIDWLHGFRRFCIRLAAAAMRGLGWMPLGASWLDAAAWAVWLVACGHVPESAHAWACRVPVYRAADPAARLAFLLSLSRSHRIAGKYQSV